MVLSLFGFIFRRLAAVELVMSRDVDVVLTSDGMGLMGELQTSPTVRSCRVEERREREEEKEHEGARKMRKKKGKEEKERELRV